MKEYKNVRRIIRKLKKYSKGKGNPLTDEEKLYYINYLRKRNTETGTNMYSTLIDQIENENVLDDPEYADALYSYNDELPSENNNISYYNDEFDGYNRHEDVDYTKNMRKIKYKKKQFSEKLYKYCEDLTAKDFKYNPAIGRNKELESLMVTILTPYKSAILTGEPGVGKTAIVEGLAYNIQHNNVPDALKGYTILQTSASILNSNCSLNGMLEKRVLELFNLLSSESKVILFIDEIHTLIGTGRSIDKSIDIANIIKPFLTSNDICLIGATTIDEYDEFIGSDVAFQRRFSPIEINEPDNNSLKKILLHTMDNYSKLYNIKINNDIKDCIADALIRSTIPAKRNSFEYLYNPDLSITIISYAFGYARLYNNKEITLRDIEKAYYNSERLTGNFEYNRNIIKVVNNDKSNIIKFNFK